MNLSPVIYRVASVAGGRRLLQGLGSTFPARPAEPCKRRAILFDTFDWRICRDDGMLAFETDAPTRLVWSSMGGEPRHRIPLPSPPGFVWDLPESPIRRALADVVEMRRLLPIAAIELGLRGIEILDDLDKTVCRVTLENGKVTDPRVSGPAKRLAPTLRVTPIKGFDDAFEGVLRQLDTELGAARCDVSELRLIVEAIGREACDVPAKQTYDIRSGMRADAAMKAIHQALLTTFRLNEPGMREDLDSEFLHDARVAVRRTRSALTQVTGVFPGDDVRRFKREFSWLGGVTGPTRDLDVYLLKIPEYRAALDTRHRADLDPLVALLEERQRAAQRALVTDLDTPRFAELMREWETFLDEPTPRISGLPNAMRPIDDVAGERTWRAWRKVIKRGRGIGPDSPAELLHRLRIDCKKLRYLLEFFSGIFGKAEVKSLIAALKKLQTNLGDLNDLAVQARALRGFEKELKQQGVGNATLDSIERLVEQLEQRRIAEREGFEARFADFSSKPVADAFRRLFRPPAGAAS